MTNHRATRIQGSLVAIVTPMQADGQLDLGALKRLIDWHVESGTAGIVIVGTTGESPTVDVDEHALLIKTTVDHVAGRIAVIAGTGANSTQEAISLSRYAKSVGADASLSVVPYYNKPTQEGLYQHFKAIAEAVDLPMILYNVPGRTVADMASATTLRLAQIPGIVGIKDATGDVGRGSELIRNVRAVNPAFTVYAGNDDSALALLAMGSDGVISVTANVAPAQVAEMCRLGLAGDFARARAVNDQLLPLHFDLFVEANPIPVKWVLARMGRCGATARLPMTPMSPKFEPVLLQAMQHAALL
jgi:4-hydroxy-tetrahydrodipicolinate synthase